MQKILYIGQYTDGTTSKMRAETIKRILNPSIFEVVDTHIPFFKTNRLLRTIGFRYKIGPLISAINSFISHKIRESYFDLIWVDKGVFIKSDTVKLLRKRSNLLVHFTPDMAFYANQSKMFNKSLNYYNYVITTKSEEIEFYHRLVSKEKIVLTTQGFDKQIHKPHHSFEEKDDAIVFIGLAEPSRIKMAEQIINSNLTLKLVGKGWDSFIEKHKNNENLKFFGNAIYGEEYSKLISSSKFALGMLSKNFPELHTTRTFEIPACGTALLTERNAETSYFFKEDEVIFYNNEKELVEAVTYYVEQGALLESITKKGHHRVTTDGYDYESILKKVLQFVFTKI